MKFQKNFNLSDHQTKSIIKNSKENRHPKENAHQYFLSRNEQYKNFPNLQNKQNNNHNYLQSRSSTKKTFSQQNLPIQTPLLREYDTNKQNLHHSRKEKKYAYINTKKNNQEFQDRQLNIKRNIAFQKDHVLSQQSNSYKREIFDNVESKNFQTDRSKDDQILELRNKLEQQKQKFQKFQQCTLQNQMRILNTINDLQLKLHQLKQQNNQLKQYKIEFIRQNGMSSQIGKNYLIQNNQFSSGRRNNYINQKDKNQQDFFYYKQLLQNKQQQLQQKQTQIQNFILEKQNLIKQNKKIKGIGRGLVDMMMKVDNIKCPDNEDQIKYAWKWIKKIVWEYQGIRKKAFQWKKAYNQLYKDSDSSGSDSDIKYKSYHL